MNTTTTCGQCRNRSLTGNRCEGRLPPDDDIWSTCEVTSDTSACDLFQQGECHAVQRFHDEYVDSIASNLIERMGITFKGGKIFRTCSRGFTDNRLPSWVVFDMFAINSGMPTRKFTRTLSREVWRNIKARGAK